MNQEFIAALRESALYVKLESDPRYGGAIDIDSLTKVLNAIKTSFINYLDAEIRTFLQGKTKISRHVDLEIQKLKSESELLIVDLNFASFEAGLSPNTITHPNIYSYIKDPLDTKKRTFQDYKSNVFFADYSNLSALKRKLKNFTPEERVAIFKPLASTLFGEQKYKFYFGNSRNSIKTTFKPIKEEKIFEEILPKLAEPKTREEELYLIYAMTDGEYDLFGPKQKIKKILATEKLEVADYPYQVREIKYDDKEIILKDVLNAQVDYDKEEKLFYVTYKDLDLQVWADERSEAEEAFQFAFNMLVKNIYQEKDEKLTDSAKRTKKKLSELILKIN